MRLLCLPCHRLSTCFSHPWMKTHFLGVQPKVRLICLKSPSLWPLHRLREHLRRAEIFHLKTMQPVLARSFVGRSNLKSRHGVGFRNEDLLDDDDKMNQKMSQPHQHGTHKDKRAISDSAWVVRLANENGYLSWCRNTYLAAAVGLGMQAAGATLMAQYAANGILMLSTLNLICGTVIFNLNIIRLHRHWQMSIFTASLFISGSLLHLVLWMTLIMMYLGYVEDDSGFSDKRL